MTERVFCAACDDWQRVEYNAHRDDMPTCYVCGSDETEYAHERETTTEGAP